MTENKRVVAIFVASFLTGVAGTTTVLLVKKHFKRESILDEAHKMADKVLASIEEFQESHS